MKNILSLLNDENILSLMTSISKTSLIELVSKLGGTTIRVPTEDELKMALLGMNSSELREDDLLLLLKTKFDEAVVIIPALVDYTSASIEELNKMTIDTILSFNESLNTGRSLTNRVKWLKDSIDRHIKLLELIYNVQVELNNSKNK